jgi:hypothetical protein
LLSIYVPKNRLQLLGLPLPSRERTLLNTEQVAPAPLHPLLEISFQVFEFRHHGLPLLRIIALVEAGLEAIARRFVLLTQRLLVG